MCDYSLHAVRNRLAVEGESLFVHKFHSGSMGLASKADLEAVKPRGLKRVAVWLGLNLPDPALRNVPAVCIPPGARLQLSGIPVGMRRDLNVGECEPATFTQVTAEPFRYRDAFRFDNGEVVTIQRFREGVRVEALALSLEEEAEIEEPATGISYEQSVGRSVRADV